MNRRSFLRRAFAAAVVVAACPTAIVAPKAWKRVKDWRNGYLTEAQAERFIQLVLDESVIAERVNVRPLPVSKLRFGGSNIPPRPFQVEKRGQIQKVKTVRPRLTTEEVVKKAIDTTDGLWDSQDDDPLHFFEDEWGDEGQDL